MAGHAACVDRLPGCSKASKILALGGLRTCCSGSFQIARKLVPARVFLSVGRAAQHYGKLTQRQCITFRIFPLLVRLGRT